MRGQRRVGQISPAEWPRIRSRYLGGDSLADIARDYGCTVQFLRGLLKRNAARGAVAEETQAGTYESVFDGYRLDAELRHRVADTMVTFLSTFDHVLKGNTRKTMRDLHAATENLLRAAARVRLALELAARKDGH